MSVELELGKRIAERAYKEAMNFFQPSNEWRIELYDEELEDCNAQNRTRAAYFVSNIVYDPEQHDDSAHLWESIGHEVAHLLLSEYDVIENCDSSKRIRDELLFANERAVTRLGRLFGRERPYPGDAEFAT